MSLKNDLVEKIKSFPMSPGVYQFIDSNGDILYVGKAKNLKSRIKSYFLKEIGRGPTIDLMMTLAVEAKFIVTDSEIEAVLLEAELINKLQPKYNARLKDDKSFLVIKITKKNPKYKIKISNQIQNTKSKKISDDSMKFSCVELVRSRSVDFTDKTAEYFGPYPAGLLLKKSINYLRKIFPFRDCSKTKFCTYRKKARTCIYGDINVCSGPCINKVSEVEYQKNINYLKNFLKGKKKKVILDLEKEMNIYSKKNQFEKAALARDKLTALKHLKNVAIGLRDDVFQSSNILFKRIECYDISNIGGKYSVGSMVVFTNGKKDTEEYRHFKVKANDGTSNDLAMMREVLDRRFKNTWPKPDLIVVDGGTNHLKIALEVLSQNNLEIPVASIAKGPKRDKNEFHYTNSILAKYIRTSSEVQNIIIASRDEAHRFAISYYRKLHKKDMFE